MLQRVSSLDVIRQFLFANECFAVYLAYFDESTSWYTDDGREFFLTLLTTSNGWWWWLGEFEQHIKTEREKKARVAGNNFSDGSAESSCFLLLFCCLERRAKSAKKSFKAEQRNGENMALGARKIDNTEPWGRRIHVQKRYSDSVDDLSRLSLFYSGLGSIRRTMKWQKYEFRPGKNSSRKEKCWVLWRNFFFSSPVSCCKCKDRL